MAVTNNVEQCIDLETDTRGEGRHFKINREKRCHPFIKLHAATNHRDGIHLE